MANTNFKVDNGLYVNGDSTFQANVLVNAHANVTQTLYVGGDITVVGNMTFSNTSINGELIPTSNGIALGNTGRRFDVYTTHINTSNSVITANGVDINLKAGNGIIANTSGLFVNVSSVADGILPIARGGTAGGDRNTGLNNLLPTQNVAVTGYYLKTDGTNASWVSGIGYTGSIGATGYVGSIGYTGSQGYTGSKGDTGYNGSIGAIGYTGSASTFTAGNGLSANATHMAVNAQSFLTANATGLYHNSPTRTDTTSSAAPGYGGTFTAIDSVTTTFGHVTAVNLKTITIPSTDNTTYSIKASTQTGGASLDLDAGGAGSGTDTVTFKGSGGVAVTRTDADNIDINIPGTANLSINNITISGNLTVSGTTTYINTTNLNVGDNIVTLNADLGAVAPTENSGVEVNRGSSANVSILWNEATDKWQITDTVSSRNIFAGTRYVGALSAGNDISVSGSAAEDYTVTVGHVDIARSDGTSTAAPGFGGTFTAVDSVTTTARGHLTAINLKTVTVPSTAASTTVTGIVQLTDSVSSTSTTTAATPNSVKSAYDLASGKAATNQTMYIGTTALAINRGSGSLSLTGVSIDGSAGTFTSTSQNSQFNSIGVGVAAAGTSGDIKATGNITAYATSDRKFKENIRPIDNALDKVNAIGGKYFDWTDEYIDNCGGEDGYFVKKSDFGVIAQDVQSVLPEAVRTRTDDSLAVDYEKLCALAFQAIKELNERIVDLESRINNGN